LISPALNDPIDQLALSRKEQEGNHGGQPALNVSRIRRDSPMIDELIRVSSVMQIERRQHIRLPANFPETLEAGRAHIQRVGQRHTHAGAPRTLMTASWAIPKGVRDVVRLEP
jgi:hypothetical protein